MIPLMEYLRGHWMELLIGSLFVCWYGYQRFNTPPSTRFSTTPRQYNAASAFYLLTLLAGYVAVSYSPALFGLTKFAGLNESLNNLSPPLIVALLMTLFMPRLPVLSDIDQRLREFYWEQASIPHEVLAVKDTLGKARYVVPAELRPEVRRELIKHDVPEQWITFDEAQLRFSPWVKVSALRLEMEAWEFDDAYRAYVRRIRSDRQRLNEQCEEFYREAAEHAKYVDRTSAAGTAVDDYVLQRAQQRLDKQADLLLDRLYLLIAQGVCTAGTAISSARIVSTGAVLRQNTRRAPGGPGCSC